MAWIRQYFAASVVGARQKAQLIIGRQNSMSVLQAMGTCCKNNIGTEVPQCESSREQIGQGRIGTFAREGIGVGAKTAYGKRPATRTEFSLGLGFRVMLGFRVRLGVRVRITVTVSIHTDSRVAVWLVSTNCSHYQVLMCGDLNCPGDNDTCVDPLLDDLLSSQQLAQRVTGPTHVAGNLLDVVITVELSTLSGSPSVVE